jgi:hypothetical protein
VIVDALVAFDKFGLEWIPDDHGFVLPAGHAVLSIIRKLHCVDIPLVPVLYVLLKVRQFFRVKKLGRVHLFQYPLDRNII